MFLGCEEIEILNYEPENSVYYEQEEVVNDSEDTIPLWEQYPERLWLRENLVQVASIEDVNLDDFWDNPNFSVEDNQEVKRIVLDFILYFYGFGVNFDDVLPIIDVNARATEFSRSSFLFEDRDGWDILDEIHGIKEGAINRGDTLTSIYSNFMMHFDPAGENEFDLIAPFYTTERRYTLSFTFQRIDGEFRVVVVGII